MATRTIVVRIKMEGQSDAKKSFDSVTAAQRELEKQTKATNIETQRAEKHAKSLELANAKLSQVQDGLTNSFIKGNLAARGISMVVNTLTSTMRFGIGEAVNYEFTLAKIEAIAGVTGTELNTLSDKIRDVATNSLSTSSDVAEAALEMAKMGVSARDVGNALGGIVGLATAADESVKETGETVIQVANVFDIASKDIARLTDEIFTAIAQSSLSLETFRTAFGYAGATAAEAGVSIEQLSGMMGTLANRGLRASTIGTGLRKVLTELSDPASKAGQAIGGETIQSIGLFNVLDRLKTVVTDVTISKELFGRTAQNVGLMLAGEGDAIRKLTNEVDNVKNKASEASPILKDTMGGAVKNLTTEFGNLAITFGKIVESPVIGFFERLAGGIGKVNDALKEKPNTAYQNKVDEMIRQREAAAGINQSTSSLGPSGKPFTKSDIKFNFDPNAPKTAPAIAPKLTNEQKLEKSRQDSQALKTKNFREKEIARVIAHNAALKEEAAIKKTIEDLENQIIGKKGQENDKQAELNTLKHSHEELKRYTAAWQTLNGTMLENNTITNEWRLNTTLGIEAMNIAIQGLNQAVDGLGVTLVEAALHGGDAWKDFGNLMGNILKQMVAQLISSMIKMLIFKVIAGALTGGTSAALGVGAGDLIGLATNTAAKGFKGRVNRPTLFMAGEEGTEDVMVKPRASTSSSGGGGNSVSITIQGDVYDSKAKFTEAVRMAQYSLNKNYVGGR